MREKHIMERSHNINSSLNRVLAKPLYFAGAVTTVLLFISPYWMRTLMAFVFNFFFNRPIVYHFYFFEKLGKKMNAVVLTVFYFFVFGTYALVMKLTKPTGAETTTWVENLKDLDSEDHFFQS